MKFCSESGSVSLTTNLHVSLASVSGAQTKDRTANLLSFPSIQGIFPRGEKDRKRSRVEGFVCLDIQEGKGSQYNDAQIWTELRDRVCPTLTDYVPGML